MSLPNLCTGWYLLLWAALMLGIVYLHQITQGMGMKRNACVAALCSTACAVALGQQMPPDWIQIAGSVYVVPYSVQRFGPTIHFASVMPLGESQSWIVSWRWAHCTRGWASDATAVHISSQRITAQQAFREVPIVTGHWVTT